MPAGQTFNSNFATASPPTLIINGITMPTPATFNWKPPAVIGINGSGRQRLYPYWECTLGWEYLSIDEFSFIYSVYLGALSGSNTNIFLPPVYMGIGGTILTGIVLRTVLYSHVILDAPILAQTIESIAQQAVKMTVRRINVPGSVAGP